MTLKVKATVEFYLPTEDDFELDTEENLHLEEEISSLLRQRMLDGFYHQWALVNKSGDAEARTGRVAWYELIRKAKWNVVVNAANYIKN